MLSLVPARVGRYGNPPRAGAPPSNTTHTLSVPSFASLLIPVFLPFSLAFSLLLPSHRVSQSSIQPVTHLKSLFPTQGFVLLPLLFAPTHLAFAFLSLFTTTSSKSLVIRLALSGF